ncbi:MAG: acetoacetate decarboxylase family protein [Syntrophobacteraceae bacterium]
MNSEKQFPLQGYTLPLSPTGRSSLVDAPPWYYGGEVMHLRFRADEQRVRELIPPPLEIGANPGEGIVWFTEWVSVSEANPDLAFLNPERAVYRECLVLLSCSFEGAPGYIVPYIWVDNDFTLMRGFVQGFPKKLGRIHITKLHDLNPKVGGRRIGAKVKGICEANGERLIEGSLVFTRKAEISELPQLRFFLMRHFPDIENPDKPAVHEITSSLVTDARFGDIWAGDAQVGFLNSILDEVSDLRPIEMLAGFYYSMGLTIAGGKVLYKYK